MKAKRVTSRNLQIVMTRLTQYALETEDEGRQGVHSGRDSKPEKELLGGVVWEIDVHIHRALNQPESEAP